jgi:hypothetical protein
VVLGTGASFVAAAARLVLDRHDLRRLRQAEQAIRPWPPWAGLRNEIGMLARAEAVAIAATTGRARPPDRQLLVANNLVGLRAALAMARREPADILYDAHELEVFRRLRHCGRWREALRFGLERTGIRRAHAVVAVGAGAAEVLRRLHRLGAVAVVHNDHFCDVTAGTASMPEGVSRVSVGARPTLVFFGSVAPGRHLEAAAAAVVDGRFATMTVFAVGDRAVQTARLESTLGALPSDLRFWRIGADYEPGIERWRREAAWPYSWVVIEPETVSYRRALPNKLFQSLRARIPVIALAGTAQGDIVERHNVGLVVAEPTPTAFDPERLVANHANYTQHIERLLDDLDAGRIRL